jgi:hypothetical protein
MDLNVMNPRHRMPSPEEHAGGALLESGGAFEELVKAAKAWEAAHRD